MNLHAFVHHVIEHLRRVDLDDGALGGEFFDGFHHAPRGVRLVPGKTFEMALRSARPRDRSSIPPRKCGSPSRPACAGSCRSARWSCRKLCALSHRRAKLQHVLRRRRWRTAPSFRRPRFRILNAMMWPRPISPSRFSTGTGTLSKKTGVVELPLMPIFFSSAPLDDAGKGALHEKRRELFAADLREDGEEIGLAAVGDPHLLAVEDVVRAVRRKIGAGLRGQRVGSRLRLAQAIGGDHFGAGKLRQIFLLSALRCRTAAAAACRCPRARHASRRTNRRAANCSATTMIGRQIHFHAAVAFGREDGFEPQRGGFAQQRDREVEIAVLHLFDVRRDFFIEELARRAGDGAVLFGEIFGREDVARETGLR